MYIYVCIKGRLLRSESGNYGRRGTTAFMVPLSIDLKRSKNSGSGGTTNVVNNRSGSIYASINPVIETNSSSDDDDDDDGSSIEEGNRKNIRDSSGVREDKSSTNNKMEHHVSSRHKK